MFGRKPPRSQRQQLMDELMESYDHLRLAAAHVAGGTAEKLTPPYDRAKDVAVRSWGTTRDAFAPLYEQMREGAANVRREHEVQKKRRWPVLVGLLAAGTAVGAVGAVVARRRRAAAQWDEYDPMPAVTGMSYGAEPNSGHKVAAGAASVADSVSSQAGKIADSLHDRSGAKDDNRPTGLSGMADKAGMTDKSGMVDKAESKTGDAADKHKH